MSADMMGSIQIGMLRQDQEQEPTNPIYRYLFHTLYSFSLYTSASVVVEGGGGGGGVKKVI